MNIRSFRQKYPQYDDMSDMDVADKLYQQHGSAYPDMSRDQFFNKLGVAPKQDDIISSLITNRGSPFRDIAGGALSSVTGLLNSASDVGRNFVPKDMSKIIPKPPLQDALNRFDPYKAVGTENKPWDTGGGALQTAGSLLGFPALKSPEMGMNLAGKTTQSPMLGQMISNLLGKGVSGAASLGKKVINEVMPDQMAKNIMNKMMNGKTLEEHGRDLAENLKNTYQKVKGGISKKYNNLFSKDGIGDKELYPLDEPPPKPEDMSNVGYNSLFRNENVPEVYQPTRSGMPDFSNPSASNEYQSAFNSFNSSPTVRNAHELQSEMASEIRQIGKQINQARINGQPVTQMVNELRNMNNSRSTLFGKIKEVMGDHADDYEKLTDEYMEHVVPYHGDRALRDIVSGKVTNPPRSTIGRIFSYPEEDTRKIISHLGGESQKDIVAQALGIQPKMATGKDVGEGFKRLYRSGYEDYLSKSDMNIAKQLSQSDLKRYLKFGGKLAGAATLEELLRRSL